MRIGATVAVVILVAAACGDSGSTTTSGPQPVTGATAGLPATTAPITTADMVTTEAPSETTLPTTTTTLPAGEPVFTITHVTFGASGFAQITNMGTGPGDLGGHWLCQRPNYFELDAVELEPGQSVWVAAGDGAGLDISTSPTTMALLTAGDALGDFAAEGGELALFGSEQFTFSDEIRGFVAWSAPGGLPGLGRMGVAVEAGIWPSSGLVEVPTEGISITVTAQPATGPDAWVADSGG